MAGSERYTTAQVIEAITKTKGMVFLAAEALGCSHQTIYNYIKRHPTVKRAWEQAHGRVGDVAELKLYNAILGDEHWAITFYLATKGKDRGYTKGQEHEVKGSLDIKLKWDDADVDDNTS